MHAARDALFSSVLSNPMGCITVSEFVTQALLFDSLLNCRVVQSVEQAPYMHSPHCQLTLLESHIQRPFSACHSPLPTSSFPVSLSTSLSIKGKSPKNI